MTLVYRVEATATFLKAFRKHAKDAAFLEAFEKKLARLRQRPATVGGKLSGTLHGYRATRILRKYRLIFSISGQTVTLEALDHRKDAY